jgi:hypothetical protein
MAFVGSLSGSLGTIAVTGSLVPVEVTNDLGATGSKWRTVFANNITGSLRNTAGGQDFISAGPNVTVLYNSLGQWEITGAAGGGAGVFTESSSTAAFTTSSIAVGFGAAASTKGSDVFFAVSGSNPSINKTTFSGPLVVSASLEIKDLITNAVVASISGPGAISGSALQTVGNLAVQGTSVLTGDVTFGGNIVADANEAKSIFTAVTSNPITVGGAGSSVDVAGTLKVTGNQISGSVGGNITLGAAGAVTVAGNLTVNGGLTGSIQKTTGGQDFIKAGPNVTVLYNGLGQWEITGAAGGASSFFTEAALDKIFTTGSVAVGFAAAASTKGSDVFFAVSSSNPAIAVSTFSGGVVASGSLSIKDAFSNLTVASISDAGVISGSVLQVLGTSALQGNVTVAGDVAVNGGNITTTKSTAAVFNTTATTVNIAGAASNVFVGAPTGKVVIPGDLEVQGTTMTVSASNLVIEDPLIGFGFLSGSNPGSSTGDRGFVGGYTGAGNNVAFGYSFANTAFVATKTADNASSTTFAVVDLQPIRASKFQISGSTAELKGDGSSLQLSGSQIDVFAGTNGVTLYKDGTSFIKFVSASYTSGGGPAGNVAKLQGGAGQGILLFPDTNRKVHLSGSVELGGGSENTVNFLGVVSSSILPSNDLAFTLGSPSARWQHIYTGDLHLRNERGDYTLIEESDFLSIRFNKNGKRYKFLLERVPELDER